MAASANGRLVFERNSFRNDNAHDVDCISGHYFNSAVDILLPGSEKVDIQLDTLMQDDLTFLARSLHLESLISPDFIEGFVKKGSVCMLSHGTCIDSDDCVCILPTGILLLNLCKDTYQELGLSGQPSQAAKHTGKYVVQIDLTNKFWPGMKSYDRVKDCFSCKPKLEFDFLISWTPQDPKVCSSSIQNYFTSNGVACNRIKLTPSRTKFRNFTVPVMAPDICSASKEEENGVESCDYLEIFDWLGACSVGIDLTENSPDNFVSSYSCPSPSQKMTNGWLVQYRGMISPQCVGRLVTQLRQIIQTEGLPWCSVTVHGFMDSPVSWLDRDHGFYSNGDNLYTLVVFPGNQYWLYRAVGGQDIVP